MNKFWIIIGTCVLSTLLFVIALIISPNKAGTWLSIYGAVLMSLSYYVYHYE